MPTINVSVKRPPKDKIGNTRILIEPEVCLPPVVREKGRTLRETFSSFGYTVETTPANVLVRTYYGYNGQDWILISKITGKIKNA